MDRPEGLDIFQWMSQTSQGSTFSEAVLLIVCLEYHIEIESCLPQRDMFQKYLLLSTRHTADLKWYITDQMNPPRKRWILCIVGIGALSINRPP